MREDLQRLRKMDHAEALEETQGSDGGVEIES